MTIPYENRVIIFVPGHWLACKWNTVSEVNKAYITWVYKSNPCKYVGIIDYQVPSHQCEKELQHPIKFVKVLKGFIGHARHW